MVATLIPVFEAAVHAGDDAPSEWFAATRPAWPGARAEWLWTLYRDRDALADLHRYAHWTEFFRCDGPLPCLPACLSPRAGNLGNQGHERRLVEMHRFQLAERDF